MPCSNLLNAAVLAAPTATIGSVRFFAVTVPALVAEVERLRIEVAVRERSIGYLIHEVNRIDRDAARLDWLAGNGWTIR